MLFDVRDPTYRVALSLILSMSVITLTFIFIVLTLAMKSHKKKIVSGLEGLIGKEGMVLMSSNEQLRVMVLGEIWNAKSTSILNVGEKIKVTHVHGLELTVVPIVTENSRR
jgi:membrane-bound serine protease (ClpP class)